MSNHIYYINAKKLVQLQQVEIEAESEEAALALYMQMAKRNELQVDDYEWWRFSEGDADIEDHGEVPGGTK